MRDLISKELKLIQNTSVVIIILMIALSAVESFTSTPIKPFSFFVETIVLTTLLFSLKRSIPKFNYAFWGISFVLILFILKYLIYFLFVYGDAFFSSLSLLTLILFCYQVYEVSSPLYYPRVRWWEYDYAYRADLKIEVEIDEKKYKARLTDFRRSEASIELFEYVTLESKGKLLCNEYSLDFEIKTSKEIIRGRPMRYGLVIDKNSEDFKAFKSFWKNHKNARIRRKFKDETAKEDH